MRFYPEYVRKSTLILAAAIALTSVASPTIAEEAAPGKPTAESAPESTMTTDADSSPRDFTIVVLPDTQNYSKNAPEMFLAQTQWVLDNIEERNIVAVIHVGDITDLNSPAEWEAADTAISLLDDAVPYMLALGNHDYPGVAKVRDSSAFRATFPASRVKDKPWYGGQYDEGIDNAYYFVEADGKRFLILSLEFGPRDEVLDWANGVIAENPDCHVIVNTHCYMYFDDTRVGEGDKWNPHNYGTGGNDGEEIWEKLASKHSNVFLCVSGHILGDGLGLLTSQGTNGNDVHQILANYQMKPNNGNGWLRIMTFRPEAGIIDVRTYSPTLEKFADDEQNKFTLPINY